MCVWTLGQTLPVLDKRQPFPSLLHGIYANMISRDRLSLIMPSSARPGAHTISVCSPTYRERERETEEREARVLASVSTYIITD